MKWLIRILILFYQKAISPVIHAIGGPASGCRFEPTCSRYFLQAVELHGAIKGSWLGVKRIGRCHPWGGTGLDPVPLPLSKTPHDCSCHKATKREIEPPSSESSSTKTQGFAPNENLSPETPQD